MASRKQMKQSTGKDRYTPHGCARRQARAEPCTELTQLPFRMEIDPNAPTADQVPSIQLRRDRYELLVDIEQAQYYKEGQDLPNVVTSAADLVNPTNATDAPDLTNRNVTGQFMLRATPLIDAAKRDITDILAMVSIFEDKLDERVARLTAADEDTEGDRLNLIELRIAHDMTEGWRKKEVADSLDRAELLMEWSVADLRRAFDALERKTRMAGEMKEALKQVLNGRYEEVSRAAGCAAEASAGTEHIGGYYGTASNIREKGICQCPNNNCLGRMSYELCEEELGYAERS